MGYVIFDPKVDRPLHELPREEARASYDWFLANIPARLDELFRLATVDGVELNFSEASLTSLHDWFYEVVLEERASVT